MQNRQNRFHYRIPFNSQRLALVQVAQFRGQQGQLIIVKQQLRQIG